MCDIRSTGRAIQFIYIYIKIVVALLLPAWSTMQALHAQQTTNH